MEQHALKYSQGYRAKKGYTFWEKDFDAMGVKTMLRQLISKWGVMSLEMQKAYEADGGVVKQDGTIDYVDAPAETEPVVEAPAAPAQAEPVQEPPMPDEPPFDDADDFASLMEG